MADSDQPRSSIDTAWALTPRPPIEGDDGPLADEPGPEASREVFIVRQDVDQAAETLAALAEWVHEVLVPVYLDYEYGRWSWCIWWWEHPSGVARLHALWLAWQDLTALDASLQGPSRWHRDHLDPALHALGGERGVFTPCRKFTEDYAWKSGPVDRGAHRRHGAGRPVAPYDGPAEWLPRPTAPDPSQDP